LEHKTKMPMDSSDQRERVIEAEGNCDGTACSPVRVAHWSQSAKQREENNSEADRLEETGRQVPVAARDRCSVPRCPAFLITIAFGFGRRFVRNLKPEA
jgi:hypothetical protein